jgi:type IV pilus assembly protein PilB
MRGERHPVVLVVDDDPAILASLNRGLSRSGYVVILADSGQAALDAVEASTPDLVLLDIVMPGPADGYEVCRALRARSGMELTPIVFVTALDTDEDEARAFTAGGTAFFRKPFELADLVAEVEKHLETREVWTQAAVPESHWSDWVDPEAFARFKAYLLEARSGQAVADDVITDLTGSDVYELARLLNLPEAQIARHIGLFLDLPFLSRVNSSDLALGVLPPTYCERNLVVPIQASGDEVAVVLANPFNWELLETLNRTLWRGSKPQVSITSPDVVRQLFEDPADGLVHVPDAIAGEDGGAPAGEDVFRATNELLRAAVAERASDLHIEPKDRHTLIRFRIDGDMQDVRTLDRSLASKLISRFKALADMDIAERRKPQDGSVEVFIDSRRLKLRLATSATSDGETLVIRLLEPTQSSQPLERLGMDTAQVALLSSMANRHQGMILIVGPTGCGKSTTVFSLLSRVDGQTRSIISVEDPVEYRIPFANQQQVNDKAGVTFESLLRSAMRQDPDILFLGEVRDPFSAKASLDFASSGHLTVSTLHSANATTAIFRLERLGIARASMADSLLGIVAQKLVKKLCPHCKEVGPIELEERQILADFTDTIPEIVARPIGCRACRETGYLGREAVNEIMRFDAVLSEMVRAGASISRIRQFCVDRGDFMIYQHAVDKVRELSCSPHDVHQLVLLEEMRFREASDVRKTMGLDATNVGRAPAEALPEPAVRAPGPTLAAAPTVPPAERPGAASTGGPTVLLVEDDPVAQKIARGILTTGGFHVTTAADGVEALLALGHGDFDVVVSDINMPNLDGLKLLEMLMAKGMAVPVLFLTSEMSSEVEARVLSAGAADFIRKPINPEILMGRVKNALGRPRAATA